MNNRTLANLSSLAARTDRDAAGGVAGDKVVSAGEGMEIVHSLPHGHVAAALGMARQRRVGTCAMERWCSTT